MQGTRNRHWRPPLSNFDLIRDRTDAWDFNGDRLGDLLEIKRVQNTAQKHLITISRALDCVELWVTQLLERNANTIFQGKCG